MLPHHTVAGSLAQTCESPAVRCDFVCDCSDCSDERDCGKFKKSSLYGLLLNSPVF